MLVKACIWDEERITRLASPKTHTTVDKKAEYALYIFSSSKGVIRAGAIGADRSFLTEEGAYSDKGNTASRRFDQYNRDPEEKTFKSGPNKGKSPMYVLPWSARPFVYVWGATLTGNITPPILLAAESMMHQRMQQSGLRYLGSSCHECPNGVSAIEIAEKSLEVFIALAPRMFA